MKLIMTVFAFTLITGRLIAQQDKEMIVCAAPSAPHLLKTTQKAVSQHTAMPTAHTDNGAHPLTIEKIAGAGKHRDQHATRINLVTKISSCRQTLFERYSKRHNTSCLCHSNDRSGYHEFHPASYAVSTQINNTQLVDKIAEGDGAFAFVVSEKTSIRLDLAFLRGDILSDPALASANAGTEAEPDVTVGLAFDIR